MGIAVPDGPSDSNHKNKADEYAECGIWLVVDPSVPAVSTLSSLAANLQALLWKQSCRNLQAVLGRLDS